MGDQLIDLRVQLGDVAGEGVDAAQHGGGEVAVMGFEPAGQRLPQLRDLPPHRPAGQLGQHSRVTLAGDQRFQHLPAGHAVQAGYHRVQLDLGVLESLLQPLLLPGLLPDQAAPVAGQIPQLPDRLGVDRLQLTYQRGGCPQERCGIGNEADSRARSNSAGPLKITLPASDYLTVSKTKQQRRRRHHPRISRR